VKITGSFFDLIMALEWLLMARGWPACRPEFARKAGALLQRWHREVNFKREVASLA